MAEGITLDGNVVNYLKADGFVAKLGASADFKDPFVADFSKLFVSASPNYYSLDTAGRQKILKAYADAVYPDVPTTVTNGLYTTTLDNEKTRLIAKLGNTFQEYDRNLALESKAAGYFNNLALDAQVAEAEALRIQQSSQQRAEDAYNQSLLDATWYKPFVDTPQSPAENIEAKTPSAEITKKLFGTPLIYDSSDVVAASSSTSKKIEPRTKVNSWVISWEPTQRIGIVKVPLSKLLVALGDISEGKNVNDLLSFNDALLFDIADLIDFKSINRRVFLPLAANRMVLLKEFIITRKNIQQTEITHGSKYFQVFTEAFPEFSLNIEAVKFADIAKKVKMFFDNVMKRISETNKYSGGLYIYDVLTEEFPSFDVSKLSEKINSGELIRYRLLPRSIKMSTSSEDPNIMKINLDGIIVEWEKQSARFNVPKLADANKAAKDTATKPNPNIIGPNEKYDVAFINSSLPFIASLTNQAGGASAYVVKTVGNTLYRLNDPKVQSYYLNKSTSLWFLDKYTYDPDTKRHFMLEYSNDFTQQALDEIYKDTLTIYSELFTYLSKNVPPKNKEFDTYSNNSQWYNNILSKTMAQIKVPSAQQSIFRKGFENYMSSEARRKNNDDLIAKIYSFGVSTVY